MAIRRYVAANSRDAMALVRRELGDDAVILANKRTPGGQIEIIAAAPDAVEALVEGSPRNATPRTTPATLRAAPAAPRTPRTDAPMPMESFQEFVRRQANQEAASRTPARSGSREPAREHARAAQPAARVHSPAGAAMYRDVAAELPDEFDDGTSAGWQNSRFGALPESARASARGRDTGNPPRPARPMTVDVDLGGGGSPSRAASLQARAAAGRRAQAAPAPVVHAEPAVFRRRPAQLAPAPEPQTAPLTMSAVTVANVPAAPAPATASIDASAPTAATLSMGVSAPITAGAPVAATLPTAAMAQPTAAASIEASMTTTPLAAHVAPIAVPAAAAPAAPALAAGHIVALPIPALPAATAPLAPTPATATPYIAPSIPVAATVAAAVPTFAPLAPAPAQDAMPSPARTMSAPIAAHRDLHAPAALQAAAPAITTDSTTPSPLHWPPRAAQPAMTAAAHAAPAGAPQSAPALALPPIAPAAPSLDARVIAELQSMRSALQEQLMSFSAAMTAETTRRNPAASRVTVRLLTAGFSAEVTRRIAAHLPPEIDAGAVDGWVQDVLALNVRCATPAETIIDRGGVYALVGPTGVGKTTTVAKLAARHAVRNGTSSLGLITLDAYRVAAPEQLRTYGRILGTPVHLAQDSATLRELLATMANKRLVLIDTCGVSQRDERLGEILQLLGAASTPALPIQRVLLLNAASHAETLDESARAWRAHEAVGAVLTKLDEASRIGGALDCVLRHRLAVLGLTNGQRVPEDWHLASSRLLAHLALKPAAQLFELGEEEGTLLASGI